MSLFLPFVVESNPIEAVLPSNPFIVMRVSEYFPEDGKVLLGPHLMTPREIDEQVDRVIADAEAFRRLAKHELDLAMTRATGR
jgi:hypothetical protein